MRSKDEFRTDLKQRRKAFAEQQGSFEVAAAPRERFMAALASSDTVAGYAALTDEPDVFPLLSFLYEQGKAIALPAMVEGSEAMVFRAWVAGAALTSSAHGFRQPSDSAPPLIPDAILVPVVGFDRAFNRLGHGAGHFDRALAERPGALKIGVAWSAQEEAALPVDPWDVPLDAVLTEREWLVSLHGKLA